MKAVLLQDLHVRRSHVGDEVQARLTAPVILRDGRTLKAGTKIFGRITSVNVKPEKGSPSRLGLLFNRVQLAKDEVIPLSLALVSVGPYDAQSGVSPAGMDGGMNSWGRSDVMAGTTSQTGTSSGGMRAGAVNSAATKVEELVPGQSFLEDIAVRGGSSVQPGTIFESEKSQVYLDRGTRFLLKAD
jgi:hypothetical protein